MYINCEKTGYKGIKIRRILSYNAITRGKNTWNS